MNKHYRALYWCGIINEPALVVFKEDQPHCTTCEGEIADEDDPMHELLMTVQKPPNSIFVPVEAITKLLREEYSLFPPYDNDVMDHCVDGRMVEIREWMRRIWKGRAR